MCDHSARASDETARRGIDLANDFLLHIVRGFAHCNSHVLRADLLTARVETLTGLRAKVGNYAGVTVERKEGRLLGSPAEMDLKVLDLPGTYSLSPQSLDEQISRDVLLHRLPELPAPALVVVVVDAELRRVAGLPKILAD